MSTWWKKIKYSSSKKLHITINIRTKRENFSDELRKCCNLQQQKRYEWNKCKSKESSKRKMTQRCFITFVTHVQVRRFEKCHSSHFIGNVLIFVIAHCEVVRHYFPTIPGRHPAKFVHVTAKPLPFLLFTHAIPSSPVGSQVRLRSLEKSEQ